MHIEAQHLFGLNERQFYDLSFRILEYQYNSNPIYSKYFDLLKLSPSSIKSLSEIPLLPVSLFKIHKVLCTEKYEKVFESSGTTGEPSKHYIDNLDFYNRISKKIFEAEYGSLSEYEILALLPSYFANPSSSLLHMVDYFMAESKGANSGYYLNNFEKLIKKLLELNSTGIKHILFGVSYALLDLAEAFPILIPKTVIIETGGMKGRRKEIIRKELHDLLITAFGVKHIHSEYGMTELLSQAYSKSDGIFTIPDTVEIIIKDPYDPYVNIDDGRPGLLGIIDLANYKSCSFILTSDLGRKIGKDQFEILGRMDHSDIRGCNLMVL